MAEFFVKAFTDEGDVVFDPFLGSGTSIAAAEVLRRVGMGCEISPSYCDVILRRISNLSGEIPVLLGTGQAIDEVAAAREAPLEQWPILVRGSARRIQHNGPAPFYGSRRKVS